MKRAMGNQYVTALVQWSNQVATWQLFVAQKSLATTKTF